jgi:hypothetical protein
MVSFFLAFPPISYNVGLVFYPDNGGRRSSETSANVCHTTAHEMLQYNMLRNKCS